MGGSRPDSVSRGIASERIGTFGTRRLSSAFNLYLLTL